MILTYIFQLFRPKEKPMILRILADHRLKAAINDAEKKSGKPLLDIIAVIFANFDEILAAINDPAALLALILKLLGGLPA